MKDEMLHMILPVFAVLFFSMSIASSSQATQLPVPDDFQKRYETLIASYEKNTKELKRLKSSLNRDIDPEQRDIFKKDTTRLFDIMGELSKQRETIKKMQEELKDYYEQPPVLKLTRITGPTSGIQADARHPLSYPVELDYKPNDSGYTRRVKDRNGNLSSSAGVAVTYAPLEITPGEPFHIEVEARQSAFSKHPCTGSDPYRMGVGISFPHLSPWAFSKTDLKCGAGKVKLTLRLKSRPPVLHATQTHAAAWGFPYDLEAATTGEPGQGSPFKVENRNIGNFNLPVKKSAITIEDRKRYSLEVSVIPELYDDPSGSAPHIVLHYNAVDESIAMLPEYQFPDDTSVKRIALPDFKGKTVKEAKAWLKENKMKTKLAALGPAPSQALSLTIKETEPAEGQMVAEKTQVTLRVYGKYNPEKIVVPDLTGMTVKTAKDQLKQKGLDSKLSALGPAPSENLSFKIKETQPGPGEKLSPDAVVTLKVYGKYVVQKIKVPKLSGMTVKAAKAKLKEKGFTSRLIALGAAPSPNLSFKVKDTKPGAGSEKPAGSQISIQVYGKYVENKIEVPSLEGLSAQEAKTKLQEKGLRVRIVNLNSAPIRSYAGKVKESIPQMGTRVAKGSDVEIRVYGQYQPGRDEQVAALDCSRWPGSKAYWSNEKGRPLCGCPGDSVWNRDKTRCVSRATADQERCAQSFPGSIPGGRNANGSLNCNCPQGYVWTADRTRCVKKPRSQNPGGNTANNRQCDILIGTIKMMATLAQNASDKPIMVSQVEYAAADARRNGCSEAKIQQAMGPYGTGGGQPNGNSNPGGNNGGTSEPCKCPPGGKLVDERHAFGQGDVHCYFPDGRDIIIYCD